MAQFRKKPVAIEAFKLATDPIPDWFMDRVTTNEIYLRGEGWRTLTGADITTLEGVMHADAGDYIIQGVKGEVYPCKPDIFAATYALITPDSGWVDKRLPIYSETQKKTGYGGITLVREGSYAVVKIEHEGREIEVIREHLESNFSHNVSSIGIEAAINNA